MPQPKRRPKRRPQEVRFVYFIEAVQLGLVKIGSADDPRRRMATLRTACPDELRLVGVLAAEDARDLEARFHAIYAGQRRRGEWFEPNEDMRKLLARLPGEDFIDDPWMIASDPRRQRLDTTPLSHFGIRDDELQAELDVDDESHPKPELEQLTAVVSLRRAGWTPRRILKASRTDRVAAWQALLVAQGDGPAPH